MFYWTNQRLDKMDYISDLIFSKTVPWMEMLNDFLSKFHWNVLLKSKTTISQYRIREHATRHCLDLCWPRCMMACSVTLRHEWHNVSFSGTESPLLDTLVLCPTDRPAPLAANTLAKMAGDDQTRFACLSFKCLSRVWQCHALALVTHNIDQIQGLFTYLITWQKSHFEINNIPVDIWRN